MTGLIGWWPLHETSGDAVDLSGNGNHASVSGSPSRGVAGKAGLQAMSFNGKDSYFEGPTGLDLIEDSFTATVWARPDNIGDGSYSLIFGKEGDQRGTFRINKTSSETLNAQFADSNNTYRITLESNPENNRWYLLAITYDGSTLNGYVDGVKNDSKSVSAIPVSNNNPPVFGANSELDKQYFKGEIVDGRLYNRALTAEEIKTLYQQGSNDYTQKQLHNGNDNGAVSRWKFDDDSDTKKIKDSWNSNSGDIEGSIYTNNSVRTNGKSMSFGGDDYIIIYDGDVGKGPTSLNFGSSDPFYISAWIKPEDDTQAEYISWNDTSGSSSALIRLGRGRTNQKFYAHVRDNDSNLKTIESARNLVKGNWYHVVLVRNPNLSSQLELYINGSKAEISYSNDQTYSSGFDQYNKIWFGADSYNGGRNYWNGLVDDIRIFNRVLKPWEVHQLYQWGTKGKDLRKQLVNQRG